MAHGDDKTVPNILTEDRIAADEREVLIYGVSSTQVYNDFVDLVESVITEAIADTENCLMSCTPKSKQNTLHNSMNAFKNLLLENCTAPIERLLPKLRQVFACKPDEVDHILDESGDDVEKLQHEIKQAQKELEQAERYLNLVSDKLGEYQQVKPLTETVAKELEHREIDARYYAELKVKLGKLIVGDAQLQRIPREDEETL